MIVTEVDQADYWTCLIRRGMLHSETEAIEHWRLEAGQELAFDRQEGVDETLVLLSGRADIGERALGPGAVALITSETSPALRATTRSAILSIRTYKASVSAMLPPRVPELPEHERAI